MWNATRRFFEYVGMFFVGVVLPAVECVNKNETDIFIIRPPAGRVWVC